MKKLIPTLAVLPGAAFAHGDHAPVPDIAHGMSHTGPVLGALIVALAVGLALAQRWRS